ncbi:hypothetical protein LOTGIDRAFT_152106 [Lottia gigantea]|uniref:Uncharacterized protein n=1 Tax=Lottia gigantea TaxID=225164 RepID=V4BH50_LOTGI|nr:hypothetical protein LOTGIDRAFT_152106 [Lottia gigantea]ESP05277.1 hypothetical protein LOTGIDRAFT_152106 [Lottia gigantea]
MDQQKHRGPKRTRESSTQSETDVFVADNFTEMSENIEALRAQMDTMLTKQDLKSFICEITTSVASKVIEEIKGEISDWSKSTNSRLDTLENKTLKNQLQEAHELIQINSAKVNEAIIMSNYNEQYSRKQNIKIPGLPESENECLVDKFCDVLKDVWNMNIATEDIKAIHRLASKLKNNAKPIIVKLATSDIKSKIMRQKSALFDRNLKVIDDITVRNMSLINKLRTTYNIESAWYFNCSVYAKAVGKKRVKIDIFDDVYKVFSAPKED